MRLWSDVEAFEPGPAVDQEVCDASLTSRRTEKARLDQSLTFIGTVGSKLISFMWPGRYTCATVDQPKPLWQEVAARTSAGSRPACASAVRRQPEVQQAVREVDG